MIFVFPDDPVWNDAEDAVEFAVEVGEYQGRVFVPRRVIQGLVGFRPDADACVAAVFQARERFEHAVELRILARALDPDANIRLTGRDLRY